MEFSQHGSFSIRLEQNILFLQATGPFNSELIVAIKYEVELALRRFAGCHWGQVIDFDGLSLFTPEAQEVFVFFLKLLKERELKATAIIPSRQFMLVKEHIDGLFSKTELNYAFFSDKLDALQWLEKSLQ